MLINNAGVGIGGPIADPETKKLDIQLNVNLRGVYLMSRESIPMLKEAGAEHGKATRRQHRFDRRQGRRALAGRLLGDQGARSSALIAGVHTASSPATASR